MNEESINIPPPPDRVAHPPAESSGPIPLTYIAKGDSMNRREIAVLACRIVAVWFFTQAAISGVGALLAFLIMLGKIISDRRGDFGQLFVGAAYVLPAVGYGVSAIVLWRGANWISRKMVSDDPNPVSLGVTAPELLSVALVISGVIIGSDAMVRLVRNLVDLAGPTTFAVMKQDMAWQRTICASIAELGLSLWLIFGSHGWVRIIWHLRNPGATSETAKESA